MEYWRHLILIFMWRLQQLLLNHWGREILLIEECIVELIVDYFNIGGYRTWGSRLSFHQIDWELILEVDIENCWAIGPYEQPGFRKMRGSISHVWIAWIDLVQSFLDREKERGVVNGLVIHLEFRRSRLLKMQLQELRKQY